MFACWIQYTVSKIQYFVYNFDPFLREKLIKYSKIHNFRAICSHKASKIGKNAHFSRNLAFWIQNTVYCIPIGARQRFREILGAYDKWR